MLSSAGCWFVLCMNCRHSYAARRQQEAGSDGCNAVPMQGEDVFPIPGTKRIHYLEENVAALNIKLTAEDKQQLEAVFAADQVRFCLLQIIPGSVTHNCDVQLMC